MFAKDSKNRNSKPAEIKNGGQLLLKNGVKDRTEPVSDPGKIQNVKAYIILDVYMLKDLHFRNEKYKTKKSTNKI